MSDVIRVITTCTSRKMAAMDAVDGMLPGLEPSMTVPAERLYAGEQHRRVMSGVEMLRNVGHEAEVWVISAKAGLVPGEAHLAPYDESFVGMASEHVRQRGVTLGIPRAVRALAASTAQLTLLLAGNDYFDAAGLDQPIDWASPTLALVSPSRARRLADRPNLRTIVVGQSVARCWSLPLTLLKGEIVRRILLDLASGQRDVRNVFNDDGLLDALRASVLEPTRC